MEKFKAVLSTALKDPIHGTFYNAVAGSSEPEGLKKNGKYLIYLQCHSSPAVKNGKTNLAAKDVYTKGADCVACHIITKFKGTKKANGGLRLGMQAYKLSDTSLQEPCSNHTELDWQYPIFKNAGSP